MQPFTFARSCDSPHRGQVVASSSLGVSGAGDGASGMGERITDWTVTEEAEGAEFNTQEAQRR